MVAVALPLSTSDILYVSTGVLHRLTDETYGMTSRGLPGIGTRSECMLFHAHAYSSLVTLVHSISISVDRIILICNAI